MARTLRRTLYVLAVIPIVAGTLTVLLGADSVPSPGDPSANLESELRFYSVWWIGAGLFLAWLAPRIEERTLELRVFCALLFLSRTESDIRRACDGLALDRPDRS